MSEKEGPGQSLEQLEALVQTKDQVSAECASLGFTFPDPSRGSQEPRDRPWELFSRRSRH